MKNTNKRPYQKPALVGLGKFKIDREALEKGKLGEVMDAILNKIKEKKEEVRALQE
jgi:hypothetical protein